MIATLAVRVLQLIFAAVVLALSVVLINQYGPGHAPSILDYGAFCGGAALLVAAVGVLACFVESLQGFITLALDGLAALFLLAGGIAFAVKLKVGNCSNEFYNLGPADNVFAPSLDKLYPSNNGNEWYDDDVKRCRMAQADTALIWFSFLCAAVAMLLSFMARRSGAKGSIV